MNQYLSIMAKPLQADVFISCLSIYYMLHNIIPFFALDRHDALFVVGSLDETLELRGLRYHPIDIETSVSRAHRSIAER